MRKAATLLSLSAYSSGEVFRLASVVRTCLAVWGKRRNSVGQSEVHG